MTPLPATVRLAIPLARLLSAQTAAAQVTPSAVAPGRDSTGVLRLAAFAGSWEMVDDGSGQALSENCAWLQGGERHMICRTSRSVAGRASQNVTIYSYRGRDSTYVVTSYIGGGPILTYSGRFDGDRWVLDFQGRSNADQRLRMLVRARPDEIHFIEESSEGDGPWVVTEDYRYVRRRVAE